ncbi:MAG: endonuclease [Firmicutes bacterium]|nr:endonuclease [Bacillota bacterium]
MKIVKRIVKGILLFLAALVVCVGGLLAYLTATEYKPADVEPLKIMGAADDTYSLGDQLTIMTWNIGYGALGDNADFFMDGGEMVKSADEDRVMENMEGIMSNIEAVNPDLLFIQEVDRDSARSYNINEVNMLRDRFRGCESTYGINYKTPFVPYPIPPLGKIDAGIMTFTNSHAEAVTRVQLPIPFKWPVSAVNLKRCVTETHVPLKGTDKELVLLNLHLEAYDSGAGKIAQTKMLMELMKKEYESGDYVIAGGDFNQIFSTEDKDAYPAQPDKWQPGELDVTQFGDGWQLLTDATVPTCRSLDQPYEGADKDNFQFYVIDGFIVSDNIQVEELKTLDLDFANSDHNPVVLKFTLK